MQPSRSVLLDLDGTLIDSQPGIVASSVAALLSFVGAIAGLWLPSRSATAPIPTRRKPEPALDVVLSPGEGT